MGMGLGQMQPEYTESEEWYEMPDGGRLRLGAPSGGGGNYIDPPGVRLPPVDMPAGGVRQTVNPAGYTDPNDPTRRVYTAYSAAETPMRTQDRRTEAAPPPATTGTDWTTWGLVALVVWALSQKR